MNYELGLRNLSQIMNWSDEEARQEFAYLRLMARLKYDGYRDFRAGMRFIESLATWLQQFEKDEREHAYAFIRNELVYIGPGEMRRLVEQFYPRFVLDRLIRTVATRLGLARYQVLADDGAREEVERLRRKTLFMGLSDGARIDTVRHSNVGTLTNEQFVVSTQIDKEKWQDLLDKLRTDLQDPQAKFALAYLVDDFTGTGTSFLRFNEDKNRWSGKLCRFQGSLESAIGTMNGETPFERDWVLCVHHYVASYCAAQALRDREAEARSTLMGPNWAANTHFSFGTVLPSDLPINSVPGRHQEFINLTEKYYDPDIQTGHTAVGGVEHIGLGFGGCALPLVLDHNTPNNSVALLWAESLGSTKDNGDTIPAMRPLFRRRQRHF